MAQEAVVLQTPLAKLRSGKIAFAPETSQQTRPLGQAFSPVAQFLTTQLRGGNGVQKSASKPAHSLCAAHVVPSPLGVALDAPSAAPAPLSPIGLQTPLLRA
jgi:hypothetical protein